MTFELRTEAAPAGLAALGELVEVRELAYGQMREAMASGGKPGESADRLLASSLYVDGSPIGYEALQALPGRLSGAITAAMAQSMRMHGLSTEPADAEASNDPKG